MENYSTPGRGVTNITIFQIMTTQCWRKLTVAELRIAVIMIMERLSF